MNKIKEHFLPMNLCKMFLKHENIVKCFNFHQVAGGWMTVLRCGFNGLEYVMTLREVESKVKVENKPLMFSDVTKEW